MAPVPPILDTEALRRRRRRRWIFILSILAAAPAVEAIAYHWRAISITVVNRSNGPIRALRVEYPGGSFEQAELDAGGAVTHLVRPNYSFSMANFSSYRTLIRFEGVGGVLFRQYVPIASLDYTAHETYTARPGPPGPQSLPITLDHTTEPGFPLGEIRSLFRRLGIR